MVEGDGVVAVAAEGGNPVGVGVVEVRSQTTYFQEITVIKFENYITVIYIYQFYFVCVYF